jgi:hypothetical protein
VAAVLIAGAAVLVAVVALMMGLRRPPDGASGAPSFVAALVLALPVDLDSRFRLNQPETIKV